METNSAATDPAVLVAADEKDPAVAVVTLNRPAKRNALTVELKEALLAALQGVAADAGVRAVVLTGSGKSFCVGQDLGEHVQALEADPATAFDTVGRHYNPIVRALATMPKPVVAAINGGAVGAGLGLALACDLRVTADSATFATAFSAIGLTADSGLSASLVHSLGAARALELLLLGESFDAAQAQASGLVRAVVPVEDVLETALELARRLAAGPTLAFAEIKKAVAIGAVSPLDTVLDAEGAGQARLGVTKDHREAVEAFLAKRRPTFEGA
ncbi:enoyl-CoA hydratase/isomerase family protein [Pseudonocardia abyssalis]|uniref:Enoyl-CoA hydratase/isomerase family protein n=1 Tax=Pseudonocardia abyssalis TaxID=2792008 RepID=A0ABS6URA0_9PSEU|nr:enoyl-CoA hydratase/isomerase family protein [Pseudonocardia abyssalis]MBW0134783.1 enoyl-CoA hydratase/isomerase family protein [Pseudonocardia abyssalis]